MIVISNDKYINVNEFYEKCKQDYYDKAVNFDFLITELAETQGIEILRCKDCKWARIIKDYNTLCYCEMHNGTMRNIDFCSCGERKIE